MLSISEFAVGDVAEAAVCSLILPRSERQRPGLVGMVDDTPFFVFLSHEHNYGACKKSVRLRNPGIVVPNVQIEVDERSIGEYDPWQTRAGAFVIDDGKAGVLAGDPQTPGLARFVVNVLDVAKSEITAAFSRWQIVVGSAQDRRVLLTIDTTASV
ncbi:hypothetical protein [Sinorhizobium fredii]|uniref:Uncharacterized protein n=1 Tax=Rhizobium fredii TaxID=380 RepID=A0A2L0H4Y5_RHIFR|nr:hypothetical protein [Sinorhizobium fredii]AUX76487.1 hypothetical protein NXT3_CH01920 [Sinorhizobium fredii]